MPTPTPTVPATRSSHSLTVPATASLLYTLPELSHVRVVVADRELSGLRAGGRRGRVSSSPRYKYNIFNMLHRVVP